LEKDVVAGLRARKGGTGWRNGKGSQGEKLERTLGTYMAGRAGWGRKRHALSETNKNLRGERSDTHWMVRVFLKESQETGRWNHGVIYS